MWVVVLFGSCQVSCRGGRRVVVSSGRGDGGGSGGDSDGSGDYNTECCCRGNANGVNNSNLEWQRLHHTSEYQIPIVHSKFSSLFITQEHELFK